MQAPGRQQHDNIASCSTSHWLLDVLQSAIFSSQSQCRAVREDRTCRQQQQATGLGACLTAAAKDTSCPAIRHPASNTLVLTSSCRPVRLLAGSLLGEPTPTLSACLSGARQLESHKECPGETVCGGHNQSGQTDCAGSGAWLAVASGVRVYCTCRQHSRSVPKANRVAVQLRQLLPGAEPIQDEPAGGVPARLCLLPAWMPGVGSGVGAGAMEGGGRAR